MHINVHEVKEYSNGSLCIVSTRLSKTRSKLHGRAEESDVVKTLPSISHFVRKLLEYTKYIQGANKHQ